ncbi:hypothetical protein FEAC_09330 [Ferrimicrobium acidiphilum DSM 19497]|uniref:Uncharacterized protein n=1 Tax=Ferrimicrobium acidiphilum DSM 19497 TaxID=1121877 RepID=A0A0D8FVV4_9ACTN|nr:hypothetical protein FEAC_09330 [Ferrimicrobium acidiphilum DSM 19497]
MVAFSRGSPFLANLSTQPSSLALETAWSPGRQIPALVPLSGWARFLNALILWMPAQSSFSSGEKQDLCQAAIVVTWIIASPGSSRHRVIASSRHRVIASSRHRVIASSRHRNTVAPCYSRTLVPAPNYFTPPTSEPRWLAASKSLSTQGPALSAPTSQHPSLLLT